MRIPSKKILLPAVSFLILLILIPLGIYLVNQVQTDRSRASENQPTSIASVIVDERFGIGTGSCDIANAMGINWIYNWGTGNADADGYPNQAEDSCRAGYPNQKFFYSVGLEGGGAWFKDGSSTEINVKPEFAHYANQFKDTEDRNNYQQLQILDLYKDINKKNDYVLYSYLLIPKYVADSPGAVYGVANEPDWGKLTPKQYAQLYHLFYIRIKKFDPTAKVMVKGLTTVSKDHVAAICKDQRFQGSTREDNCNSDGSPAYYKWMKNFREEYKKLYGGYPRVDIWGIHPYTSSEYIVQFATDALGNRIPSSYKESNWDNSWMHARNQIVDFREEFLKSIGEENTEVWVPEFGVGGKASRFLGPGGISKEDNLIAEKYMTPLLQWLKATNYVKKWFWYYGANRYHITFDESGNVKDGLIPDDWQWPELGDIWCSHSDNCSQLNLKGEAYKVAAHQAPFSPVLESNGAPIGAFDAIDSNCNLYGWATDPDIIVPLNVDVYAGGPAGTGQWVVAGRADRPKRPGESIPDNTRFVIPLPNSLKDNRDHDIYVYALDASTNSPNTLLPGSPKRLKCSDSGGGLVSPSPATGAIDIILQNFGGSGGQSTGDQNNDSRINELDFGAVYSR